MAANNLKVKLQTNPTMKERFLLLICNPVVGRLVTFLPIPRKWKAKILHKQFQTLTKIFLALLKRALAEAKRQDADVAPHPTQSDDVNTTSSNWEKQEDVGQDRNTFRFRA